MSMTDLNIFRLKALLMCVLAISFCAPVSAPAHSPDQFDKPVSVQTIKPKPNDPTEIRCTTFADLMIRETQDGPESENAAIVREAQAPCTAKGGPGETVLDTAGMTLDGRRGAYLLFSDLNPHGATGFAIIDAKTGKILLRDAALSNPVLRSLALENGNLRLRYQRGVNAPCSLMDNARKCWARLIKDGLIPGTLKAPSSRICQHAYKQDRSPRNNPSIVSYTTEVVVDTGGTAKVMSRGVVRCTPMP
jgi:hypothetical protein